MYRYPEINVDKKMTTKCNNVNCFKLKVNLEENFRCFKQEIDIYFIVTKTDANDKKIKIIKMLN